MKLNINFLQTGGVPLTNDLMDLIQEQIKFYDFLGELAGNLTILSGCVVTGSSISSGVVAINGECYYLEGGLITSTVYINTQQIYKTFQDQTDKILIERKTVKFGTSTPNNMWNWVEFSRLDKLKEMQDKIAKKAEQTTVLGILERVMKLEIKTAPIKNGGIVWIWKLPVSEIPFGWKECTDLRGKTVFGRDPNDAEFQNSGNDVGSKTTVINVNNLPPIPIKVPIAPNPDIAGHNLYGRGNLGGFGTWTTDFQNQPLKVLNPGRVVDFIEPDFQ